MSWIKLVMVNVFVFLMLLLSVELICRAAWTLRSCLSSNSCNFSNVTTLKLRDGDDAFISLGFTEYHSLLGYIHKPGFDARIPTLSWRNAKATINKDGFRGNDNQIITPYKALIVGDSFTFGDQVSNHQTWPSCFERNAKLRVANAGVGGYGAAQSVLRAKHEMEKRSFDYVLLGVYLRSNFKRDQLIYRDGFPRPAVAKINSKINWDRVPAVGAPGTLYGPQKNEKLRLILRYGYEYSQAVYIYMKKVFPGFDISGMSLNKKHPYAATEYEIVNFTLEKFSEISAPHKYLVLLYGPYDFYDSDDPLRRRAFADSIPPLMGLRGHVNETAERLEINVIDTYQMLEDELGKVSKDQIWWGHNTSYGNELVCKLVTNAIVD